MPQESQHHVVLLGDAIFDNVAYTGAEPDVISHLRSILPNWSNAIAMQCLTDKECAEWLSSHSIQALHRERPCVIGDYEVFSEAPKDARAQQYLARDLLAWIGEFETALFWITDWPFYQPDEAALVSSLRKCHGEHRWLLEAPGHVFASDERDELIGWVYLMMCFGWDGYLYAAPYRGSMFQTSHEDFVWLFSSDEERFTEARRIIQSHGLKVYREGT